MNEYKKPFGAGAHREGNFKKDYSKPSFGGKPAYRGGAGKSFGGGKSFGNKSFGGGTGEMFPATCASCGKACEVPFKPNGKKPIYCRDCFAANGGGESSPRGASDRFAPRKDFSPRPYGKPEFKQSSDGSIGDLKRQIETLHAKLDKVITLLGDSKPEAAPSPKMAAAPEASESAPAAASEESEKTEKTHKKESKKPSAKKKK